MFNNFFAVYVFVCMFLKCKSTVTVCLYKKILNQINRLWNWTMYWALFLLFFSQIWLGSGLLLKPELECISPVKVYKALDSSTSRLDKLGTQSDNSSFSNSIYFLSKSSKCAVEDQLEPCSLDSPYGPAGGSDKQEKPDLVSLDNEEESESGINSSVESSFDNQLQKIRLEVQSPDSGFAGSSIDHESQDESGSEGLPSPPAVDSTLPISHVLQCPVPQLGELHPQFIQPKLGWNSWNNQTMPSPPQNSFFSNLLNPNSSCVDCSGMVEPCSDDYLSVNKVQD